jgi:catechol 2,3-dioxygenase-like lactoylglutathione lyase family enzyme
MNRKIALITILTNNVPVLRDFYREVLGFEISDDMGEYVEFKSDGVRFAVCSRATMQNATGDESFKQPKSGQSFELAFEVESPEALDELYNGLVARGAKSVQGPETMPWGQRTAFFADPDGNIHELFTDL